MERLHADGRSIADLAAIHTGFVRTIQKRCMVHSNVAARAFHQALDTVDDVCSVLGAMTSSATSAGDVSTLPSRFQAGKARFQAHRQAFKLVLQRQPDLMLMLGYS